ncbi:MAG: AtpZ/AtpI family protein [Oscillospiraceae bacterium]|nr:AtpZ/AtpI family protein [Oscillospiraceae bacterium]
MQNHKKTDANEFARALAMLSQVGISIIACVAVGIGLGWFLDRLLNTTPWLMLVFTIFGIVAAIKSIFEFAKKI